MKKGISPYEEERIFDPDNEWVKLAHAISWGRLEAKYAEMFPDRKKYLALPFRTAFGALIIQKRRKLSDRAVIREIRESSSLQYFLGRERFSREALIKPSALAGFRKCLTVDYLMEANECILLDVDRVINGQETKKKNGNAVSADIPFRDIENLGTEILDVACSPSNIKYHQDYLLLNEAREKLEVMIDYFCMGFHMSDKPRTYRKIARNEYLAYVKSRKCTKEKLRAAIRKQLGYIRRDLGYLENYMEEGYALPKDYIDCYLTIWKLYRQQKYMYDNRICNVENRIVSISQPYPPANVGEKEETPVEAGAGYCVSIDEKGRARLEKISVDSYNENGVFKDVMNRYKERTGHYPGQVLVDQIYRTRDNRRFCRENGIIMSGPKLGRPSKDKNSRKEEQQDHHGRMEGERFFATGKCCDGAGLIRMPMKETTLSSIALSILAANLFAVGLNCFFLLYFLEDISGGETESYIVIDERNDEIAGLFGGGVTDEGIAFTGNFYYQCLNEIRRECSHDTSCIMEAFFFYWLVSVFYFIFPSQQSNPGLNA